MKYYRFDCPDNSIKSHVFFESDQLGYRVTRKLYKDMTCLECTKVDEYSALRRGIELSFKPKLKKDLHWTPDGINCISDKFRSIILKNNIKGIDLIPIPSVSDYFVIIPTVFVETIDKPKYMTFLNKCSKCGRYKETTCFPMPDEMKLPDDPMVIFSSSIKLETTYHMHDFIIMSHVVKEIFSKERFSGIDYYEL